MDEWSHPFTYDAMTGERLAMRDYPMLPLHNIGGSTWGTYAILETTRHFAVLVEINGTWGPRRWLMPIQYALPLLHYMEPLTGQWAQHRVWAYSGYDHYRQRGRRGGGHVSMLTPLRVPHAIPQWLLDSEATWAAEKERRDRERQREENERYPDPHLYAFNIHQRARRVTNSGLGEWAEDNLR